MIPVPGGIGVLEGGLVGALILYGAPPTQAVAGVLVYHAIAFWIPSLGGLWGYHLLRRQLAARSPHSDRRPTAVRRAAGPAARRPRVGSVPRAPDLVEDGRDGGRWSPAAGRVAGFWSPA